MARVQHPNVIAVHDVGTFAGGVFVAMELVDGTTLSGWLEAEAREWHAIVDVLVQAGRGLAAAHAVGLVHRDFKPANVLLGADGRARVVDFGLARSTAPGESASLDAVPASDSPGSLVDVTRTGTLVGTPSYMSPEQLHGMPVDARSDQFSFAVALYRALFGERPYAGDNMVALAAEIAAGRLRAVPKSSRAPAWLQKVVLRGLSAHAEDRWPTMDAMLAALQHDPARIRRRWMVGGGVVVGLLALALPLTNRSAHLCGGGEGKLAGVWDDATRTQVHAAFAASGKRDAEVQFGRIAGALDSWAHEFAAAHVAACEATRVRHEQSEELLDLRMECLGQRLDEARADVELFSHADGNVVDRSMRVVSSMTSLGTCSDLAALRAPVRPPTKPETRAVVERVRKDVARARAISNVSKYDEAATLLRAALVTARSTGYRPVEAEVLNMLGWSEVEHGKYDVAEEALFDAVTAARAGRDAVMEVNSWTSLVRVAEMQGRYDEAQRRGRYGLAAFEAIGGRDQRPLARLLMMIGSAAADQGRFEEALDYDRRAVAIRERPDGGNESDLAGALEALGRVLGDLGRFEEDERTIRRSLVLWEKTYGQENQRYASALFNLAFALAGEGRYEEALAAYRRTLDIWERTLGPQHPRVALALTNIGDLLFKLHRYDESLAYNRRALAVAEKTNGPDHRDAGLARSNMADVLRMQHKYDEALAEYQRALAIFDKKLVPDHPFYVYGYLGVGLTELDRKQPARALPPLERALAVAEKHTDDRVPIADARFALARAEWEAGRDRGKARERAMAARATYASERGQKEQLAAVDEWLAHH
jgi:tetratricopeptide (TPR) repeat protein